MLVLRKVINLRPIRRIFYWIIYYLKTIRDVNLESKIIHRNELKSWKNNLSKLHKILLRKTYILHTISASVSLIYQKGCGRQYGSLEAQRLFYLRGIRNWMKRSKRYSSNQSLVDAMFFRCDNSDTLVLEKMSDENFA